MKRFLMVLCLGLFAGCSNATLPNEDDTPSKGSKPNTATAEDWKGQTVGQAGELLEGRFPGVQIFRVSGGIAVRIRGAVSMSGDTEPLYVIDGQTIEAGPGGALMGINPADIEKIEVLKDIGSTSMYGSRGANGVIVIRTKRGR